MIAEVIIDIAHSEVDKVFDYIAAEEICVGHRVLVPFGSRVLEGYVIALKKKSELADSQLKAITRVLDDYPVLLPELLELCKYMVTLYHLRYVDAVRLLIPTQMRGGKVKELRVNKLACVAELDKIVVGEQLRKGSKKQFELLGFLEANKVYLQAELNKQFGLPAVNKFVELKLLDRFSEVAVRTPVSTEVTKERVRLTQAQKGAIAQILAGKDKTHLLHGVTGSGKTEVYLNVIKSVVDIGKTAILLVPEISLTPQMLGAFRAEFAGDVAILHSGLSAGERFDEWRKIRQGQARIVVGARSAIFAPLANLGIVIIDEEHDTSYKSESNPRYLTHDVAKYRAHANSCPLVLGSATPSLESFHRAKKGEYNLIELASRINEKELPQVQIVDMCAEIRAGNSGIFSNQLLSDLSECLKSGNQAMIFINRRGYSSFMMCRECGYVAKCTDCDVSLVYHKEEEALKCHFCNKRYRALTNCPQCNSVHIRQGAIGTQRVVSELKGLFPNVDVFRMDNDTTRNKNAHMLILDKFARTKPSILVGTQMIAKGHDFPAVTLVGIIDADLSLHFSDFRSAERTFQLITQVSGRAGRADLLGKVVLQTYTPKHYVYRFAANYNYKGFYEKEINLREVTSFPPFAKVVRLLVASEIESLARDYTFDLFKALKAIKAKYTGDFLFCEAMRAPVSRVQNKHRFQILMRIMGENERIIIENIYSLVDANFNPKVLCFAEINPNNLS